MRAQRRWRSVAALSLGMSGCAMFVEDDYQAVQGSGGHPNGGNSAAIGGIGAASTGGAQGGEASAAGGGATSGLACDSAATPNPDGPCPDVCTGGCANLTCYIACGTGTEDDEQICKEAQIVCPEGFACHLTCNGEQTCERVTFDCPTDYSCSLTCVGHQACKELRMHCNGGPCSTQCETESACEKTAITCDDAACTADCAEGVMRPNLDCGDACRCEPCP